MSKSFLFSIILSIVVAILLYMLVRNDDVQEIKVIEKVTTDTLYIYKHDTIVIYEPKYITKKVVDTVYINDTIPVPISQTYYSEKNLYELWVRGYKTTLDSIKVYNKVEEKIITNNVVEKIYPQTDRLYVGGGFQTFSDTFIPYVGVSLATPKKVLIGANLGVYNNKAVYGVSVYYRILGK